MKTEPDLDGPEGVESLLYISQERVREITREAAGGAEFFIQVEVDAGLFMYGLTNYGRLFRQSIGGGVYPWEPIDVPDFDEVPAP